VVVTQERPVLLLRRGRDAWIVSARGRVLRTVTRPRLSSLPRTWVPRSTRVDVGATLPAAAGGLAAAALAPLAGARFPGGVHVVRTRPGDLTLVLRTGVEIRLGDPGDLRLKYAIARRILTTLDSAATPTYLDVSVPERPVSSPNSQVVSGG
jgi:hypothetical protein